MLFEMRTHMHIVTQPYEAKWNVIRNESVGTECTECVQLYSNDKETEDNMHGRKRKKSRNEFCNKR